mgnify:CR=1 FL=1|tara:strand:+ start:261 stop:707 length:447 start_codon:yes stop_codon:yes gene_type:complete
MIGTNNTSTTRTKGKRRFAASLLTPTLLGNYAMSLGTTNGQYDLSATVLASIPGHSFLSVSSGTTIGSCTVYVYNMTQGKVQKVVVPLRLFIAISTNVLFLIGHPGFNFWNSLGLTMPSSGDSMLLSAMIKLDGARPVGGWKQSWTAS